MPGYTDQSRRYLRLPHENYKQADATKDPELKAKFIETAAGSRDLALQIDDPSQWQAKHFCSGHDKTEVTPPGAFLFRPPRLGHARKCGAGAPKEKPRTWRGEDSRSGGNEDPEGDCREGRRTGWPNSGCPSSPSWGSRCCGSSDDPQR